MTIWVVEIRRGNQYLGLAIDWTFDSKITAQWWIDNQALRLDTFQYTMRQLPVYSLEDIQRFTA